MQWKKPALLNLEHYSIYSILVISFIFVAIIPIILTSTVTYLKSSQIIKENASQYTTQMLKQTNRELDLKLDRIEHDSVSILTHSQVQEIGLYDNGSSSTTFFHRYLLRTLLFDLITTSGTIERVSLFDRDGSMIISTSENIPYQSIDGDQRKEIEQLDGKVHWSFAGYQSEYTDEQLILAQRVIKNLEGPTVEPIAFLSFEIPENIIFASIRDLELGENGYASIVDSSGTILSSQLRKELGDGLDGKIFKRVDNQSEGSFTEEIGGEDFFVTFHTSAETGWKILGIVPLQEMTPGLLDVQKINLITAFLWVIVAIFISIVITRSVTNPIKTLIQEMRRVEKGDFSVHVDLKQNREISILSNNFNQMIDRLKGLIKRVYEQEISEKKAELKALQAQINPHFLYNTLDTIYWMLYVKGEEKIGNLITSLADMLRYSIGKEGPLVSIGKEMENLNNYIHIQSTRYGDRIRFQVDIDDGIEKARIIKFMLQPIVENAITHGIEPSEHQGIIDIKVKKENKDLLITISDNGVGMSKEQLQQLVSTRPSREGLGIQNVHERVQITFGKSYGLDISSEKNEGTTVFIRLPLIMNERESGQDENNDR